MSRCSPAIAAAKLWQQIPEPPPKRAKPSASWRTLKPNQYLRPLAPVNMGGRVLGEDTLFCVTKVNSLGATITHDQLTLVLTDPNWKAHWARARKPKAKPQ